MEDDMLLLLTYEDSPLFILNYFHEDKTNMVGGIMSVKEDGFKDVIWKAINSTSNTRMTLGNASKLSNHLRMFTTFIQQIANLFMTL
jgi:hypothetical protein